MASLLAVGCATHQTARMDAVSVLAEAPSPSRDNIAAVAARDVAFYGDKWTAANLYEQAVDSRSTVRNRYALARSYQSTGRRAEAAALYRGVIADGQYTRLSRDSMKTYAQLASVRLAAIDPGYRMTLSEPGAILSAGQLGTPVSATVGAPSLGRISDQEALRRDGPVTGG
ncbi:MAG: hypothetical protein ABW360_07070 [Phenylobacterium sp.]